VIIPLDLTQLSCPCFMLAAGLPSSFTTNGVGCWGGALWRVCNLTSFSPCLTGPMDYLFASHHKGPRFKSPGGYLFETGILLLVMSRYKVTLYAFIYILQHSHKHFHTSHPFSYSNTTRDCEMCCMHPNKQRPLMLWPLRGVLLS
jgi:hypothetical protein